MILEWMDHDLRMVRTFHPDLVKIVARSVLEALAFIKEQYNCVHTGW